MTTGLAAALGCGSPQPAAAPRYDPVNSPEAETACPTLREAAQTAREVMLETPGAAARESAARAVLAHAECERAAFEAMSLDAATEDALLVQIRAARAQYQTAKNLYDEVIRYNEVPLLAAGARVGDLHAAFAAKLRVLDPPPDLRDPAERAEYQRNLDELARVMDREAALAYAQALETAAAMSGIGDHDVRTAPWIHDTCAKLRALDPAVYSGQSACAR